MENVLSICMHLSPADSKKNITVPFSLARDAGALILRCRYAPKSPADHDMQLRLIRENIERDAPGERGGGYEPERFLPLKNLITLSLDDPDGYRGAAHRQDAVQEHRLTKDFASPGFYPGEIKKGSWQVVLNVHALITDTCDYELEILTQGGDPDEA